MFFSSADRLVRLASFDNSDATIGLFCLLTGTRIETFVADLALLSAISDDEEDDEEEDDEDWDEGAWGSEGSIGSTRSFSETK